MAIHNPPSWLQGGSHPAVNDRLMMMGAAQVEGVLGALDLKVSPSSGLILSVAAGGAFILGDFASNNGMYHVYNDAAIADATTTVNTAHATLNRRDLLIAEIKDNTVDGGGLQTWQLRIIAGTPSGSPVLPTAPGSALPLAEITVNAADTTIGVGEIIDMRKAGGSWSMARGLVIAAATKSTSATDQTGITGVTDIAGPGASIPLSVSVPMIAGRRYWTRIRTEWFSTVTTDSIIVQVTDGSNAQLDRGIDVGCGADSPTAFAEYLETAATTTTATRKGRAGRASGSGTVTVRAPREIAVYDMGGSVL